MVRVNHLLDYTKCTVDELRGFVKSRTGKVTSAQSIPYLVSKLRALDKNFTFRFMDLPAEMRLAVYGELLHRPDPFDNKTIHAQILASSKDIYREAEPELTERGNMVIRLTPMHQAGANIYNIGTQSTRLFDIDGKRATEGLWPLYEKFVNSIGNVQNITLHLDFTKVPDWWVLADWNDHRITPFLFALTAALRTSKIRTLTFRLDGNLARGWEYFLWPLHRIKSTVQFSMQGITQQCRSRIFSTRLAEDSRPDVITKGIELMARVDELATLLACLKNPALAQKVDRLRARLIRGSVWEITRRSGEPVMRLLCEVEAALDTAGMRRMISKAVDILKESKNSDELM